MIRRPEGLPQRALFRAKPRASYILTVLCGTFLFFEVSTFKDFLNTFLFCMFFEKAAQNTLTKLS
jgi:hypothetical protein